MMYWHKSYLPHHLPHENKSYLPHHLPDEKEIVISLYKIYPWKVTSLVAQMVKNPPAMCKTRVWSLGWKDRTAIHSSILAWRIS